VEALVRVYVFYLRRRGAGCGVQNARKPTDTMLGSSQATERYWKPPDTSLSGVKSGEPRLLHPHSMHSARSLLRSKGACFPSPFRPDHPADPSFDRTNINTFASFRGASPFLPWPTLSKPSPTPEQLSSWSHQIRRKKSRWSQSMRTFRLASAERYELHQKLVNRRLIDGSSSTRRCFPSYVCSMSFRTSTAAILAMRRQPAS